MRSILIRSFFLMILASCSPNIGPPVSVINSATSIPSTLPTSTYSPTPNVTKIPSSTPGPQVIFSQTSPNGEYIAKSYINYSNDKQMLEIRNREGKLVRQIPYQGELPHGDPRTYLAIVRWSNDSTELIFCYSWSPDGGDIFIRYPCGRLQKIDIETGEIQLVIPEGYAEFAISPDGVQIAYISCGDEFCLAHVRNLLTGAEKTASVLSNPSNYVAIGSMEWSPSGNGIVFHTQDNDYMLQTIYLNPSTMEHKLIWIYPAPGSPDGWAAFDGWVDDSILIFVESGDEGIQVVHLNIRNNESIVIGTPTP